MTIIIIIMSIVCFLNSWFFLGVKLEGELFIRMICRLFGLLGTICPILYWFKLLSII